MKRFFRWLDRKITESRSTAHKLCELESGSILLDTARIINLMGQKSLIHIGSNTNVRGELLTFAHGGRISIGEYCYVGENTRIWSASSIKIGDRVLISHNVNIFDNDTHPIHDPVARHNQFKQIITSGHPKQIDLNEKEVVIEDDALIACNSVILKGVTIGKAAVVAAGSVVVSNVPPYTIVAGNPAKVVRKIAQGETNEQ